MRADVAAGAAPEMASEYGKHVRWRAGAETWSAMKAPNRCPSPRAAMIEEVAIGGT